MAMNSKFDQNTVAAGDLKTLLTEEPETVLIDLLSQENFASRNIGTVDIAHGVIYIKDKTITGTF
jgi:hypothetical protein